MPAPKRTVLPSGEVLFEGERCTGSVRTLAPGVTLTKYAGHLDAETCETALMESATIAGPGARFTLYIDTAEMSGYTTEARVRATEWLKRLESRIVDTHILPGSKLVAMGVAVVNLAVGGRMRVHGDRRSFEAALRAHR